MSHSQKIDSGNTPPPFKLHSGGSIPPIGYGVYQVDAKDTTQVVYEALVTGYRLIDSAVLYKNEMATGEGITKFLSEYPDVKRSDIFYTSKIPGAEFTYKEALEHVKESLDRVKHLEYIDLYLIHFPSGNRESRIETYKALIEAKKLGWVKEVGVSNYGVTHLEEIIDEKLPLPAVNQIELSPWLRHHDIVSLCGKHNITLEAYSPLTRGTRLANDKDLQVLAKKYNKTPAQILLRWSHEYNVIPLPKTTSERRMRENYDIWDFQLSKEDWDSLGSFDDYSPSNPSWDPTKWPLTKSL